jgi:hypothetical protein
MIQSNVEEGKGKTRTTLKDEISASHYFDRYALMCNAIIINFSLSFFGNHSNCIIKNQRW